MENWEQEMRRLEEAVTKSDGDGVRARWESGRFMLTLKKGKQLPAGVLGELEEKLGVHRSELTARMKFATKFPTEDELTNAISEFRTWFAIKRSGLTTTPRVEAEGEGEAESETEDIEETSSSVKDGECRYSLRALRRAVATIEEIDPAVLDKDGLDLLNKLEKAVRRIRDSVKLLEPEAA